MTAVFIVLVVGLTWLIYKLVEETWPSMETALALVISLAVAVVLAWAFSSGVSPDMFYNVRL